MTFQRRIEKVLSKLWDAYILGIPFKNGESEWEAIQMFIDRWLELEGEPIPGRVFYFECCDCMMERFYKENP